MKLSNIFTLLLAGFALAGTTSCVDKVEYEPAEPVALAPYYFSTGNGDREDLEEGQSSFTILLGRLEAEEELEVPVEHNSDIDAVFNVPTSVKFAKGESTATLEVTFDLANVEKRKEYTLDLNLNGVENTPYYLGDLSMIIYYNPWESIGTGKYTEASVCSIFGDVDSYTYDVEIQEHPTEKGYYRLVNPYGPDVYPMNNAVDYGNTNRYMYFNAVNPEGVYVETMNTGWSGGTAYGNLVISSVAYRNMQDGETLEEQIEAGVTGYYEEATKNLVMPAKTLVMAMTNHNSGVFGFSNSIDCRVVLPGGKVVSDWEEIGFCNYTDGFCGPFMKTPVLNNTYQVYVEYNSKTNVYRVTDPFGVNSGYETNVPLQDSYIYFNVENTKCVTVGTVMTIINSLRDGRFYATTLADIELGSSEITKAELAEAGIGGTFDDKVIRIPGDQICGYNSRNESTIIYPATPVDVVLDIANPIIGTKKSPRKVTMPLELRK